MLFYIVKEQIECRTGLMRSPNSITIPTKGLNCFTTILPPKRKYRSLVVPLSTFKRILINNKKQQPAARQIYQPKSQRKQSRILPYLVKYLKKYYTYSREVFGMRFLTDAGLSEKRFVREIGGLKPTLHFENWIPANDMRE